ncbi:MAG TPA: hypothetical protein PLS67_09270 [Accumulibacter sp.]|nr:hypothetical protein [Accumulibacter sp.]HQC80694.1 hypothetical protein [Accumulibacter sp.]
MWSVAYGVSADGTVVVGNTHEVTSNTSKAFRWTQTSGMVGLGTLNGGNSLPHRRLHRNRRRFPGALGCTH